MSPERIEEIEAQVVNPGVSGILIQASEMAELLVRSRDLDDARSWMRRAVCFIGAAGQDEQTDESADELIFSAHVLFTTSGALRALSPAPEEKK